LLTLLVAVFYAPGQQNEILFRFTCLSAHTLLCVSGNIYHCHQNRENSYYSIRLLSFCGLLEHVKTKFPATDGRNKVNAPSLGMQYCKVQT